MGDAISLGTCMYAGCQELARQINPGQGNQSLPPSLRLRFNSHYQTLRCHNPSNWGWGNQNIPSFGKALNTLPNQDERLRRLLDLPSGQR